MEWLPVIVVLVVAVGFPAAIMAIGQILGPKRSDRVKTLPYECGIHPTGDTRVKVPIKFYLLGVLLIVFDVEVAFLYPWAVALRKLGTTGFLEMLLFIVILAVGLLYAWLRGALEWEK